MTAEELQTAIDALRNETAVEGITPPEVANILDDLKEKQITAQSYSTTETLTGGTWIDGKPIYRKVTYFNNSDLEGLMSLILDSNYPDLEVVSRFHFILNRVSNSDKIYFGNTETEFPIIFRDTGSGNLVFQVIDTNFNVLDLGQFDSITLILEYTKTTD